jgi:hypothetical protein
MLGSQKATAAKAELLRGALGNPLLGLLLIIFSCRDSADLVGTLAKRGFQRIGRDPKERFIKSELISGFLKCWRAGSLLTRLIVFIFQLFGKRC